MEICRFSLSFNYSVAMMRRLSIALTILLSCATSANAQDGYGEPLRPACIRNAELLLDEALSLMKRNYYRRDSVNWQPLVEAAKKRLSQSSDCEAAYQSVQWCFDQMKEQHSFIMPPVKAALYSGNVNSSKLPITRSVTGPLLHELIESDMAYISVPWISSTDNAVCTGYADSLQSLIRMFDQEGISKWIIDLRNNTGGNCWPMLAGLGPLLGNGIHGYFVSSKERIPISYMNGVVLQGRQSRFRVSDAYTLTQHKKTIIILTGEKTSSAGEIIALAFKGRDHVYLYGEPTAGLTTANATYPLSDGSLLVLTVCKEADRHGKIVEGKIYPDEFIESDRTGKDVVRDKAIMFLQLQE